MPLLKVRHIHLKRISVEKRPQNKTHFKTQKKIKDL